MENFVDDTIHEGHVPSFRVCPTPSGKGNAKFRTRSFFCAKLWAGVFVESAGAGAVPT